MEEYHKIQSVYKRDPKTNHKTFMIGDYSMPEFEYLKSCNWVFTEKVDGTNIRVIWDGEGVARFKGRTENAQLPVTLYDALTALFQSEKFRDFHGPVTLYGEGFGPKIQKGGGNYGKEVSFALFDVQVDGWWLKRDIVIDIADRLGLQYAPVIGNGTLDEMVSLVQNGIKSTWGDFEAEGIVARPEVELFARNGKRIITKVKCKDFK